MKSLLYFWRSHLAVTLGAAVACAVLTGALIVGDSVRGSLSDLVLDRLGEVDQAIVSDSFVRSELAGDLASIAAKGAREGADHLRVEPIISIRGSVIHRQRRASGVQVFGVGSGFSELFPKTEPFDFERQAERRAGQITVSVPGAPGAIVNESLARELDLERGDVILVAVERPSEVPRETLVGRQDTEDTIERIRLAVTAIVPDTGAGGFRFSPGQAAPLNLFVPLDRLQRALLGRDHRGRVNTFLLAWGADAPGVSGTSTASIPDVSDLLAEVVELEDLSLTLAATEYGFRIGSRQFVLADATTEAITEFAGEHDLALRPSLTYLANSITSSKGSVPYSTITALDSGADSQLPELSLTSGEPAPALSDGQILIDAWTAKDLGMEVGQLIELTYYELGARDELSETTVTLELAGVVTLDGPAIDAGLTPDFPGMADAEDIAAWDPPFPVELARIRDRDEEYWDLYRAAPKAFVSLATGRRLWTSRFGHTTTLEIAPAPPVSDGSTGSNGSVEDLELLLRESLPGRLARSGGGGGLRVLDLRADGLEAARGATDFGGLFLALSFFLIGSAALLVALLFRLAVEQRAREVGLLRAVGFPEAKVRRRFLGEGLMLAAVGSVIGVAAAAGYAAAMLAALRTWWLSAVGTTVLTLHLTPMSLAIGWLASVLTVAFTLWLALRNLRRVPAPSLLAGAVETVRTKPARVASKTVASVATAAALVLLLSAPFLGSQAPPLVAMGIGFLLLIAGIAFFAHRLRGDRRSVRRGANQLTGVSGRTPVLAMGARNTTRNAGRSLASVALIASAVFLLVIVGANRRSGVVDVDVLDSGAGGFRLLAASDVPIHIDLNDPERQSELGFSSEDSAALAGPPAARIVPLRRLPGEDASCLNLYRPGRPNVLGVPAEMIARGGFAFQSTADDVENPWELLDRELEPGVIPAIADYNSAVWILHLGLGKDLVLEDQNGEEVRLRLVGLLKKSVFQSEILVSERNFLAHFPRQTGYSFFLIESPPGDDAAQAQITEILEGNLDRFGFDVTSTAERIATFQAVENTYIATFQTLGGLGLLLGTIGLGVVLLRNVLERRGELATLQAFGFRRSLLAKMVLAENGVLLLIGIAIGSLAGIVGVLPNLLTAGHHLPGVSLVATIALVFVVGMLASSFALAVTVGATGATAAQILPALKGD
ncbi:MAG: ABC transporter permease [Acidobacteria bacterium]|nr:ABC transporter permease [Acidobacteriota bacterium]